MILPISETMARGETSFVAVEKIDDLSLLLFTEDDGDPIICAESERETARVGES